MAHSIPDSETVKQTPRPRAVLTPLFDRAKATDEFEFACALLRIRGMEDAYWDPLQETYQLTRQLVGLINAPVDDQLQLRLLLFLYCHATEADDLLNMVANLLRICRGDRYSFNPFSDLPKRVTPPHGHPLNPQVEQLIQLAQDVGFPDVGTVYENLYVRPVRNAFYHSDYVLSPESFNIRNGEGVNVENIIHQKVPYEWLMPRLELGVNTALAILELLVEHIRSYKHDKVVKGRFAPDGSYMDVQLTTNPDRGLTGFKSPPDATLSAKSEAPSNMALNADAAPASGAAPVS